MLQPGHEDMNDTAVLVNNVSKKFCRNLRRSMLYGVHELVQNLAGMKPDTSMLRKDEFWALQNVSFELKQREALGIIGANGSGKTTLLRILTGIFPPDKGEVIVKGRVGALVAVGAGFHPHMTGRENVFLNGTILGMSKKEIENKFASIVEFADIGDFLEAPIATYSSGMRVRLGFSIAIHCDPDILIADEVLSVGDYAFRMKCYDKMQQLLEGCSVILVSHNETAIRSVCQKTAILHKNRLVDIGDTDDMLLKYRSIVIHEQMQKTPRVSSNTLFMNKVSGAGGVKLTNIELRDKQHELIRRNFTEFKKIAYSEKNEITCILEMDVLEECWHPRIAIYIRDLSKAELTYACGVSISRHNHPEFERLGKGGKRLIVTIDISRLTPNVYTLVAGIGDDQYHLKVYDHIDETNKITFEIISSDEFKSADALLNRPYFLPKYHFEMRDIKQLDSS